MDTPFTDDEKRFVLTEMIKASRMDIQSLVDFVRANCLSNKYDWCSVPLPTGRTVNQCKQATDQMLYPSAPPQSLKREPPSRLLPVASPAPSPQPKPADPANAPSFPNMPSGPSTSRTPTPLVQIQPRPVNGTSHPAPTSPAEPPAKKRRGRPARRQNLRCGSSNQSQRPLQPLAPQPAMSPAPVVAVPEGKSAPGNVAGEARGKKRGRESSDETVGSAVSNGIRACRAHAVKEIKAEGSVATSPARNSPADCRESDGPEEDKEP